MLPFFMARDADHLTAGAGIKALPPTTVRQIGSSQVIVGPSSVVKELIDNALDARATGIFVDIHTNAISSIQVKDNGHGIPAEDRPLVCRRYCTSKIRDFHDLREIGGKWLGFRGEAMASMAELSEAVHVTTRVEGEPVAVLLSFGRIGELESTARASHPVGTTVKVTNPFHTFPVRKQDALKHSAKFLSKIKRMMQAYALARPTVRFQLRVLKAKTGKGNFNYAPKPGANVEDAAFKVIGRDCASQCGWTALNSNDFEVLAFLPKPDAVAAKIANHGAFLSVDARPVAVTHGTMKKISALVKERLRKSNPALASVKDPFLCMNIICPSDSYDPNIEPAKDNVLFDDEKLVLNVVEKLLSSFYPEAGSPAKAELSEPSLSQVPSQPPSEFDIYADAEPRWVRQQDPATVPSKKEARWRSTMYGVDEEDLDMILSEQSPVIEEEEGARAAKIYNPWTIAKMNAAMKPRKPAASSQLMTPAKSTTDMATGSSSPLPSSNRAPPTACLLTPQPTSQVNAAQHPSSYDEAQDTSTKFLQRHARTDMEHSHIEPVSAVDEDPEFLQARLRASRTPGFSSPPKPPLPVSNSRAQQDTDVSNFFPTNPPHATNTSHFNPHFSVSQQRQYSCRSPRKARAPPDTSAAPAYDEPPDLWFGQPMRGTPVPPLPRTRKRPGKRVLPLFPTEASNIGVQGDAFHQAKLLHETLTSENNTDIREFFGGRKRKKPVHHRSASLDSSFAAANSAPAFTSSMAVNSRGPSKPVQARRTPHKNGPRSQPGQGEENDPPIDIGEALRAYAERELPPPSTQPQISKPFSLPRPRSAPHSDRFEPVVKPSPFRSPSPTPGPSNYAPAPQRTRSSYLPLEHTPTGQNIQNILLPVAIPRGIGTLRMQMRKLDMQQNSLEWGCPAALWAEEGWNAFAGYVSEEGVGKWVSSVVRMLDGVYEERCEGGQWDVEKVVLEGVWRVVGRMQDGTKKVAERAQAEDIGRADGYGAEMEIGAKTGIMERNGEEVVEQTVGQGTGQRMDFLGQRMGENIELSTGHGMGQAVAYQTDDEFADKDLDEEMLLM